MKKNVAIIGSGISGLSAAYLLSDKYNVHLYEKNSRLGGHTRTLFVQDNSKKIYNSSVSLPSSVGLKDKHQKVVIEELKKIIKIIG